MKPTSPGYSPSPTSTPSVTGWSTAAERFRQHIRIDAEVLEGIEDCIELAPLHNPANLKGIAATTDLLGSGVPQVAVFDTAFHASMPEASYIYAIPYQLYRRHKIRRYGFHGTSHQYLVHRYGRLTGKSEENRHVISLHLGKRLLGVCRAGRTVLCHLHGLHPAAGLVMGTRSGDIDPSLVEFLMLKEGMDIQNVDALLNKHSGLLGVSGLTGDMRELLEEEAENSDRRVTLAIEIFCRRVRHYIGGYFREMGGADAVIFSGGIGENSHEVRRRICDGLQCIGLILDVQRNQSVAPGDEGIISTDTATLAAHVIPTNEELLIARETLRVLS